MLPYARRISTCPPPAVVHASQDPTAKAAQLALAMQIIPRERIATRTARGPACSRADAQLRTSA